MRSAVPYLAPAIGIVIPVFNHCRTLRDVVVRTLTVHDQIIVVDDGSTDGDVREILSGLEVCILCHPENLGKGRAILTAAHKARELGMTHIITIDADGQHNPDDIRKFIPLLHEKADAIIVGTRNFEAADVPGPNRFGRSFSNFWFRLQTGKSLGDVQSGFRAYPVSVLENLKLNEPRYSFEVEVLVKAAWAGVAVLETAISVIYPPDRISHFHLFWDNVRLSVLNFKLTMRSVAPVPHRKIVESGQQPGEKITVLHPLRSIKTLLTENASPEQLAAAGALGVLLGTLPLIACHTIAILFAAGFFRLNKIAALSTSQLCMPPLVPGLCVEAGYFMRHGSFLTEFSLETIGYQALDRFYEWLIGSLMLAPALAILTGGIIYLLALVIRREKPIRDDKADVTPSE
ncbi:MAG: glycosyl transferase family 2 [Desulfobacteraceae bacterium 4572_88]|nr:MAG: glycosyl transferase family 2 [Desulfobacteraceae bacterium 4572_88]